MATLTADVTAEATSWNVSVMPGVNFLQVDDEIVRVLFAPSTRVALATGASAHLSCKFVYSGSPATQGEVDVYALLAESA